MGIDRNLCDTGASKLINQLISHLIPSTDKNSKILTVRLLIQRGLNLSSKIIQLQESSYS